MKFSVITPSFNGMPHIKKCVGSVRAQASGFIAVEHLIQDGISKDDTVNFGKEFQCREDVINQAGYVFSFKSEADDGMYDAINKGWARADGDIFSWLNSDEQYLPGTLEKVSAYFQKHPEADVVFGNMIIVDSLGAPIAARREIDTCMRHVVNGVLFIFSGAMFFHRRLFDRDILRFDTKYKLAGDMDLALHLMACGAHFCHVDEYLSLFVADGENLTTQHWDKMQDETMALRTKYNGHNSPIRRLFLLDRYVKRRLKGCHRNVDINYDYILDESGKTKHVAARGVGYSYSL